VEGLAQGLVLAAQGGAESLAPGPAPGRDQGPGPDRCLVAVPGPGHGQGLMAGTDPEAEADHEMLKESNKKFTKHLSDEKKHMYDFIILETHTQSTYRCTFNHNFEIKHLGY